MQAMPFAACDKRASEFNPSEMIAMDSAAFIAGMNGLQREIASMPAPVSGLIVTLLELVDLQNDSVNALLAINQKLLDEIDRLKR